MSDANHPTLHTAAPEQWPVLLQAIHLAQIFDTSLRTAQRRMAAGTCGPVIEIAGRRYIRREVFLAALRDLERTPQTNPTPRRRRRRARRHESRTEDKRNLS